MSQEKKAIPKAIISAVKTIAIIAVIYSAFLIILQMFGITFMQTLNFSSSWKEKELFEKDSLYYYTGNSAIIRVEIDKGTETNALTKLVHLLDNADSDFIKKCSMIRLTGQNVLEAANVEYEDSEYVKALTDGTKIFFNDENMTEAIFYHEMSHIYDINHDELSTKDDFQKLYNDKSYDNVISLASDVRRDSYEGWAAGSMLYWLKPDSLKEVSPDSYDYFEKLYAG